MIPIVTCLHSRLEVASHSISSVTPSWARETWSSIVSQIDSYSPSILVFANARESTDSLLTTAARMAKFPPKIVMELPNLFPSIDFSEVDAVVGPSQSAVTNYSVLEKFAEAVRKPSMHVVNPGVDGGRWRRREGGEGWGGG